MPAKHVSILHMIAVAFVGCTQATDTADKAHRNKVVPPAPASTEVRQPSTPVESPQAGSSTAVVSEDTQPVAGQSTIQSDANAANQAPAKADAKPTQPAEPATFTDVIRAVDLRKFPIPIQAESYQRQAGQLSFDLVMTKNDVEKLLRGQMEKFGCVESKPSVQMSKELRSFHFAKAGLVLTAYIHEQGAIEGKRRVSLNINNHGNLDARTLEPPADCEPKDAQFGSVTFTTTRKVNEVIKPISKQLTQVGWLEYRLPKGQNVSTKEMQFADFIREGIHLRVSAYQYAALGAKTHVNYTMSIVQSELPIPPNATKICYDEYKAKMDFELPGSLDDVVRFYKEYFEQSRWKPFQGRGRSDGKSASLVYHFDNDVTWLDAAVKDGTVKVSLKGLIDKIPEDIKKAEQRARAKQLAKETNVIALPLPDDATNVTLNEERRELKFKSDKSVAELVAFYRKKMTNAGWKERKEHTRVEEQIGNINIFGGGGDEDDAAFINMFRLNAETGTETTAIAHDFLWKSPADEIDGAQSDEKNPRQTD